MTLRSTLLALALLALATTAQAERSMRFGDYVVHYNMIPTATLVPDIARQYGIQRSRERGLITLTLLGKDGDAAEADVTATVTNLNGQRQTVAMREVREGPALYYIGTFRASDGEKLTFNIAVRPQADDRDRPLRVDFIQHFHGD